MQSLSVVMKQFIIFILVFGLFVCLFPFSAHSRQPIKVIGRIFSAVAESNRKEVLPYANVMLLVGNDSLYIKGSTSDIDGYFCIQFSPRTKFPVC